MKRFSFPAAVLAALLGAFPACTEPTQPEQPAPPASPPGSPPQTPSGVPVLSGEGDVFHDLKDIYRGLSAFHGGALHSRYVLFEDGTFALEFVSSLYGPFAYTGRYSRADSVITFDWDGWSVAGPWEATGTLRGDSLAVRYNVVMMLTDFVDGTYFRSPSTQ